MLIKQSKKNCNWDDDTDDDYDTDYDYDYDTDHDYGTRDCETRASL